MTNQKEEIRLQKESFQTMAKVIEKETIDQLRGWKPPTHAYILFEMPCMYGVGAGEFRKGFTLCTMNLENRPEQKERFYYHTRKGARPIHFGNFPRHDDADPRRAQKARMHTGPDHVNPWDDMARLVKAQMARDGGQVGLKEANAGLEAKLAEARAELENLKRKKVTNG